MDTQCIHT